MEKMEIDRLKRFDEEMRKRFGVRWAVPSPASPEEDGEGARTGEKVSNLAKASPARTKPNRVENEFMLNLMVLRNALVAMGPAMRDRARRAGKTTWRDIRLMTVLCCKVQEELLATMPKGRDDYYLAYAKHGHYELVMNGPLRNERLVLISDKRLAALCEASMESECIMCTLEGSEIARCPLRQALLEVAPPRKVLDGKWARCEYREAASQLINGKEVTV